MPSFVRSRPKQGQLVLNMMTLEHAASSDLSWGSIGERFLLRRPARSGLDGQLELKLRYRREALFMWL